MTMNRAQRRGAARVAGSRTDKMSKRRVLVADDACRMCAYMVSTLIGQRAQDFKDAEGRLVEILINQRIEPPYGVRFPKDAAKRQKCLGCAGVGLLGCLDCKGSGQALRVQDSACSTCLGKGKIPCEKCAGSGINWVKGDFAPLCEICGRYLMAWLQIQEQRHVQKLTQSDTPRIILPNQRPRVGTGRILLG